MPAKKKKAKKPIKGAPSKKTAKKSATGAGTRKKKRAAKSPALAKIASGLFPFSENTPIGRRARSVRDGVVQGVGLDPDKDYAMKPDRMRPKPKKKTTNTSKKKTSKK